MKKRSPVFSLLNSIVNRYVLILLAAYMSFASCGASGNVNTRVRSNNRLEHQKHVRGASKKLAIKIDCTGCIPTACAAFACSNTVCQSTVRGCHEVSSHEKLFAKVRRFYNNVEEIPEARVYNAGDIERILTQVNCGNKKLEIDADDATSNNTDIVIRAVDYTPEENAILNDYNKLVDDESRIDALEGTKYAALKSVFYSIAYFKGVMQLDPATFHFYKAKSDGYDENCQEEKNKFDIVFYVKNIEGDIIYYGDVSDMFP